MSAPKLCRGCATVKPIVEFHRRTGATDGRQSRCKECQKAGVYAWRAKNPEATTAVARRSYVKVGRSRQFERLYGITEEQVERLADEQGRRCAICGRHESESVNGLHVDHDHVLGGIRGLLCQQCNTALGKFGDDRSNLAAAIHYLDRYLAALP